MEKKREIINMATESTITVVTDDNKEYTIRVCGTASDPYFFGKDVCEVMELKNHKKAIFDNVSDDHKKELKNLRNKILQSILMFQKMIL